MNPFPDNLRLLRNKKNMSQRQLAEELNISRGAIASYEGLKKIQPSFNTLIKISEFFEVSIDNLLKTKL